MRLFCFLSLSVRPTYHWSLNKLIKDRIPGSPGPAIRTHGQMTAIRGGLHLNGHNAWLGAGDFSGGCISGMITLYYYTTQAVRGPKTKINQSKCSIAGPIFSKYWTGHCLE